MKNRFAAIVALCALVGLVPAPSFADDTAGIAGYVIDGVSHRPMQGVPVVIVRVTKTLDERAEVVTDRHGFFLDLTLMPGRYAVTASVRGRSASCIVDDAYGGVVRRVRIVVGASNAEVQCIGPGVRRDVVDPDQTSSVYRV